MGTTQPAWAPAHQVRVGEALEKRWRSPSAVPGCPRRGRRWRVRRRAGRRGPRAMPPRAVPLSFLAGAVPRSSTSGSRRTCPLRWSPRDPVASVPLKLTSPQAVGLKSRNARAATLGPCSPGESATPSVSAGRRDRPGGLLRRRQAGHRVWSVLSADTEFDRLAHEHRLAADGAAGRVRRMIGPAGRRGRPGRAGLTQTR